MLRPACIVSLLFASMAIANGYITPSTPMNYVIDLNNSNLTNETGYVTPGFTWDLNTNYSGSVTCPTASIPQSPAFYRGVFMSNLPPVGNGYVRLNDFLDMRVQIWIEGYRRAYVEVPFDEQSNNLAQYWCTIGTTVSIDPIRSGSKGIVSFRVRRPIINGIQISDRQIVEMYGRLGSNSASGFSNIPMSRITISSALLYVPERCVINAGQTIEVEFGDIPTNGLDGNRFEKTVPLTFRCEGGAFEGNALKISLAITGRPASFNQDYLATSSNGYQGSQIINNLGIKFKQLNGDELKLQQFYPVNMLGNIGDWGFIAAPVSPQGANIPAGDFYATATIVAAFQ